MVVCETLFISRQNPNMLPVNEATGIISMMPNVKKRNLKSIKRFSSSQTRIAKGGFVHCEEHWHVRNNVFLARPWRFGN